MSWGSFAFGFWCGAFVWSLLWLRADYQQFKRTGHSVLFGDIDQ